MIKCKSDGATEQGPVYRHRDRYVDTQTDLHNNLFQLCIFMRYHSTQSRILLFATWINEDNELNCISQTQKNKYHLNVEVKKTNLIKAERQQWLLTIESVWRRGKQRGDVYDSRGQSKMEVTSAL